MDTNELNAALTLKRKIDRLEARLDDLRQTGGVGGTGSNTPVQGGTGMFVGQIATELAQEIWGLQRQFEVEQVIIRRYIEKLDLSDVEQKLMVLRYVECKPWAVIQKCLGYAARQTYRIHDRAKNMAVDGSL